MEQDGVTGISFARTIIDKVGKRDAIGRAPIPKSGEPENIIEEIEGEPDPARFGPLYELIVTSESRRPPGAETIARCASCGREEYDKERRTLVLTAGMVPDADVFLLTTLWIIVNERVRHLVTEAGLTNFRLSPIDVVSGLPS